ncbi:MAG: ribonuclease J [Persicimonas sp.]
MTDNSHTDDTYNVPAPPEGDYVRFIPLGGLDEVGMNCAIIECNGSMLLVDCGLTFPEDEYGIDIVLPDWSYVMENLDKLDAVLLTHGHEDHIGSLPFFLEEVDVPVYSGRLTLAMLYAKLQSHNLANEVDLFPCEPGEVVDLGPFRVEFLHINHSVPNAMAITLGTPLGEFVFTGDWKLDQTPVYGEPMDLQRFAELGRQGVTALFGDSTNSGVPGLSTSERVVYNGFSEIIENAKGRVIIAQFSSNVDRIRGQLDLAHKHGRKVALLGRSIKRNFNLAREEGFLKLPADDILVDQRNLDDYPADKLLVISTGSQAEPRASLSRMALGDHYQITLNKTDTVITSARMIPGNERGIHNMLNNLAKTGATIITPKDGPIHASGHGKREELKLMINLTRPKHLVPVHGEYRMRQRHAQLGKDLGIEDTQLIENGDVLEFDHNGARVVGRVDTGRMLVDGKYTGDLEEMVMRDRAKLANSGMVVAFVVMDRNTGQVTGKPSLMQRGFIGEDADIDKMLDEASKYANDAIHQLSKKARRDTSEVYEAVRSSIRRFFRKRIDRKPVVIPVVHEV